MRDNYTQYKFYHSMAIQILEGGLGINDLQQPAHFICEASRVSKKGLRGEAHSHWVSGLFDQGVYLFADNYKMGLRITEAPGVDVRAGCQNSRAYGNPWPEPTTGKWVDERDIPAAAKTHVANICREMVEEAALLISKRAERLKEEMTDRRSAEVKREQEIKTAWGGCKGIEIAPGDYSGCNQSGGDCPECGK